MNNFTIENPMAPPWLIFPTISRYSIGWRMGSGEYYAMEFSEWFNNLTQDEKQNYTDMFGEPKQWIGYYMYIDNSYRGNYDEYKDFYVHNIMFWEDRGRQKYSIEKLKKDFNSGKKIDILPFWGHRKSSDGTITKSCMSQWWLSDFAIDTYRYCCMEQYMMAEKAILFEDTEIESQIMNSNQPSKIKSLGRKVKNFDARIWDECKYSIVLNGNYYKFTQNRKLMNFLFSTQNKILVEASPHDTIWGIGMSSSDKNIYNPNMWIGKNLLGFALMEVRDEIKRVYKNYDIIDWESLKDIFGV